MKIDEDGGKLKNWKLMKPTETYDWWTFDENWRRLMNDENWWKLQKLKIDEKCRYQKDGRNLNRQNKTDENWCNQLKPKIDET